MPLPDLQLLVVTGTYTRYLVPDGDGEQPLGFVHAEDVLRAIDSDADRDEPPTAGELAREVLVVPETRRIDEIPAEFEGQGGQMAVVIDEWGVFEGVLTIEDVLEEIVGDIRDEFDMAAHEPAFEMRDGGVSVVDGGVPVQAVNDRQNVDFERDYVETIGGFVFSHLGRVPEVATRSNETGLSSG